MSQYLGIDMGDRRIGLATGNDETGIARPLEILRRSDDPEDRAVFQRLKELIKEWGVEVIVVGDPINMDGSRGERSEVSHAFAKRLKKAFRQVQVVLSDERLSSYEADAWMDDDGIRPSKRKENRDAYAAATILRHYFGDS
ncbi:MAG: Holliday junction resolvase RuvX [Candidatus Sumerlaeota bacterium]